MKGDEASGCWAVLEKSGGKFVSTAACEALKCHFYNKNDRQEKTSQEKMSGFLLPGFQTVCRAKKNLCLWMEKTPKIEQAWIACPLVPSKRKWHRE